jgi:multidrug efflux pump subunit AcrA (membrane-fusion protein)
LLPQRLPGEDRPLYAVTITPNALPVGVVSGMTADASIIIAQQPGVLRLPRGLVQPNSQGIAVVKVWQDRQIASREVLVGLRGDVYVEIVAGLGEGDEIVGE